MRWDKLHPLVSALGHLGISRAKKMDSSNGCWQHFLRFSRSLVSVTGPFVPGRNTRVLWEYNEKQVAQRVICSKVCKRVDCKITESKYWLNDYINVSLPPFQSPEGETGEYETSLHGSAAVTLPWCHSNPSLLISSKDGKVNSRETEKQSSNHEQHLLWRTKKWLYLKNQEGDA